MLSVHSHLLKDTSTASILPQWPHRFQHDRTTLLIVVLVVNTLGHLTRIRRVLHVAVLPIFMLMELSLELESVVDVGETELDVAMALCILATLDAIDFALVDLATASSELHEGPVVGLDSADGPNAACDTVLNAVLDDIVDGAWAVRLLDMDDDLLHITDDLDAICRLLVVFVARSRGEKFDDRMGRARLWHGD